LAHLLAAFHPGSRTEANSDVGTVGDLQGSCIAIKVPEDATRHSAQFRHRRIIRMNANAHPQLFRNRHHLPDEIGVVFPKLFLAVSATVSERPCEDLAGPMSRRVLFHVEGAGRRSAASGLTRAAPDAVCHVSV